MKSDAGRTTVICVGETTVVGRDDPSYCASELPKKLAPVSVIVVAPLPAATLEGVTLASVGAAGGAVTESPTAGDVPPPGAGVNTVTIGVAIVATSAAIIAAVRRVPETNAVTRSTPFTRTADAETNPLPSIVRENDPLPAATLEGLSAVIAGAGL